MSYDEIHSNFYSLKNALEMLAQVKEFGFDHSVDILDDIVAHADRAVKHADRLRDLLPGSGFDTVEAALRREH